MTTQDAPAEQDESPVLFHYTGEGYLFNVDHADITEAQWATMPQTVQEAILAHPLIYQRVDSDKAGPQ